jgi:hypothetical protein
LAQTFNALIGHANSTSGIAYRRWKIFKKSWP